MKIIRIALSLAASSICRRQKTNGAASAFVAPSPSLASNTPSDRSIRQETTATSRQRRHHRRFQQLFSTASDTTADDLETEIKSMRVSAIKQELESYGISTRTFLEKGELVDALVQARKEGKTPVVGTTTTTSSSSSSGGNASASGTSSSSRSGGGAASTSSADDNSDRQERIREEMSKAQSQKVSELKSELESYGVSTKSFFEKSEFVRAVAEARVDGVVKKSKKKKRRYDNDEDEVEEVKAKVEVITNDNVGPKTKKNRDGADKGGAAGGNPFGGAGGSPFGAGGGGSPFGGGAPGMDMGSIADMLKGMGGMGGAGAGGSPFGGAAAGGNPFAGAAGGANPFGGGAGMADAMKAAQQAMSNPKVRAVMDKAQKNPKVMAAVQECMGNPAAMGKYMSDPEVGPILKELQDAMM